MPAPHCCNGSCRYFWALTGWFLSFPKHMLVDKIQNFGITCSDKNCRKLIIYAWNDTTLHWKGKKKSKFNSSAIKVHYDLLSYFIHKTVYSLYKNKTKKFEENKFNERFGESRTTALVVLGWVFSFCHMYKVTTLEFLNQSGALKVGYFQKKIVIIYRLKQICCFTILNSSFEFSCFFCWCQWG